MTTALITGASSGIGYELAWLFATDGHDLILVARSEEILHRLAEALKGQFKVSVRVLAKDLSLPRAPDEIFIELQRDSVPVDFLVNNAGFGGHGFFAETDLDEELRMIQLNLASLTHLTKLFLPEMLKRRRGKILNLASTAAFVPGPLMAVYYATKAYVRSFSEALAEELKDTGVSVTCLCPGPTITEFQKRANLGKDMLLLKGGLMDSKGVARIGYKALMKNKRVVVAGWRNKFLMVLAHLTPRSLVARVIKILQARRK